MSNTVTIRKKRPVCHKCGGRVKLMKKVGYRLVCPKCGWEKKGA